MARDNMELLEWGDGTTRLAYWDSEHGLDQIFILGEDGTAYTEADDDIRTAIDFVAALRALAKGWRRNQ